MSSGPGPSASDCLFILKAAVGSATCEPECVCAPADGLPVLSSDALRCLRKAVGQDVALECGCTAGHGIVRVHYPAGESGEITLRGTGGGLSSSVGLACQETENSLWVCDLGAVSGTVDFRPFLDDTLASKGAEYRFEAPGEIDVYPFFSSVAGQVVTLQDVSSTKLGNSRDVAVYLPPSYAENTQKRYPILFMQDGQNLFDPETAFGGTEWEVDEALDQLATTGAIMETIVVAPYSTANRSDEYTPTFDQDLGIGGDGDLYLDFLLDELTPQIESLYRVDSLARPGIAGSSLGGLIAIYGAWTRHEEFARVAAMSPSLFWDDEYVTGLVAAEEDPDFTLRIYLDVGDVETGASRVDDLKDVLITKGWTIGDDLLYLVGPGHLSNETFWRERAPSMLAFLLKDPARVSP